MDPNNQPDESQPQGQSTTPKQQVTERIRTASNVLVTVKSNPSVDELAATIGLTLMLNKLGKHTTAVFSGEVPSTLEFLKPEETLETNTDSLRDFIVSLDKSKADKLRYKVEENVVKIFITPYKTSISQDDLEFTQGDFNVDVVLALGVTQREELDKAITSHGRILHDATVVTVTAGQDYSELGQINWQEQGASSLSEMLVSISEALQSGLIDEQIATAFLTGIVSETERFSNTKTSPKVMTMSAQLMAAGANQQLIANELGKAVEVDLPMQAEGSQAEGEVSADEAGTLSIKHAEDGDNSEQAGGDGQQNDELPEVAPENQPDQPADPAPEAEEDQPPEETPAEDEPLQPPSELPFGKILPPAPEQPELDSFSLDLENNSDKQPEEKPALPDPPKPIIDTDDEGNQIQIDVEGNLMRKAATVPKHKVIQPLPPAEPETPQPSAPEPPTEPPANSTDETPEPDKTERTSKFPPPPETDMTPSPPIQDNTTIEQIEEAVNSPHLKQPNEDSARGAVEDALGQQPFNPANQARADVGGLPMSTPPESTSYDSFRLPTAPHSDNQGPVTDVSGNFNPEPSAPASSSAPADAAPAFTLPGSQAGGQGGSGIAPPPVPPPMLPR